jgi:Tol biopolymer transport system component
MAIAAGTHFGPYEILALLGAGGMGEVYRARDTRLDRTVAVKVLAPVASGSADRKQRFEREARALSSFSHPHICALYDVGAHDGTDYLVMEYLDGETLAERLTRGPLPFDLLLGYAVQIADALDQAHEHRLTHRDLKPGNVMLTRGGAKLLDFGLAKALPHAPDSSEPTAKNQTLTETGGIVGTCQYVSPEQLQGKEADARSDIFAFGAVLYEAVTGKPAFPGEGQIAVASAILEKEPAALESLRPPLFERVVRMCLAKDPAARWQSARDLKRQLEWISEGVGQETRAVRAGRMHAMAWALALGSIALLAALLVGRGRAPDVGPAHRTSVLPPPGVSFEPFHFALSPDGQRLAFIGIGPEGQTSLWIRSLDQPVAQEIKETVESGSPFWAPDSRRLGFFADGKLKVLDTSGGAVQVLCDAPAGRGGTWNGAGTIVFAPNFGGPLQSVSDRGGTPKQATPFDPESGKAHRWPSFLPDGRRFLYFQDWGKPGGPHPNGIYVASLDGGEPKLISADLSGSVFFGSGHLLYFQDGSLMAQPFDPERLELAGSAVIVFSRELSKDGAFSRVNVSLSENGAAVFQSLTDAAPELVWFDRSGREVGRVAQSGLSAAELSPNGRFLAATSDEGRNGRPIVRIVDLSRGIASNLTGGGHESNPTWSPDGTRIAYLSGEGSRYALYQAPADGSGETTLLLEGPQMLPNDYLPDGRGLLYMSLDKAPPHLGLYDFAKRTSEDLGEGVEFQLSPDGRWLAGLMANREGHHFYIGLTVKPFSGPGPQVPITKEGGAQPRWSGDGKRLFFIATDRKMMEVEIDVRGDRLRPGVPHALFQTRIVAPVFVLFQYDVTADGNRFLVNSLKPQAPLTLVTNWPSTLSR